MRFPCQKRLLRYTEDLMTTLKYYHGSKPRNDCFVQYCRVDSHSRGKYATFHLQILFRALADTLGFGKRLA